MDYYTSMDPELEEYETSPQNNSLFPVAPRKKVQDYDPMVKNIQKTLGDYEKVNHLLQQDNAAAFLGVQRQPQTPISAKPRTFQAFQKTNGFVGQPGGSNSGSQKPESSKKTDERKDAKRKPMASKSVERDKTTNVNQSAKIKHSSESSKTRNKLNLHTPEKKPKPTPTKHTTPSKHPPNGLVNGLNVPQDPKQKLPKLIIPPKDSKPAMKEPLMEDLFREFAHPPLLTAIQTPKKTESASTFAFPNSKETSNKQKPAESISQDKKEKSTD